MNFETLKLASAATLLARYFVPLIVMIAVAGQATAQSVTFVRCEVPFRSAREIPRYFRITENVVDYLSGANWENLIPATGCVSTSKTTRFCEVSTVRIVWEESTVHDNISLKVDTSLRINRREGTARSIKERSDGVGNYDLTGPCTRLERDPATVSAF